MGSASGGGRVGRMFFGSLLGSTEPMAGPPAVVDLALRARAAMAAEGIDRHGELVAVSSWRGPPFL